MQSFLVSPPLYFCNCFFIFWLLSLTCCYLFSKVFFFFFLLSFQVISCSEIVGVSSAGNYLPCLWTLRASEGSISYPHYLFPLPLDLALLGMHPPALFAPCIMRAIIMFDHFDCPWFFFFFCFLGQMMKYWIKQHWRFIPTSRGLQNCHHSLKCVLYRNYFTKLCALMKINGLALIMHYDYTTTWMGVYLRHDMKHGCKASLIALKIFCSFEMKHGCKASFIAVKFSAADSSKLK